MLSALPISTKQVVAVLRAGSDPLAPVSISRSAERLSGEGKPMKPGIDVKGGLRPTGPWARAPEGRDDLGRVGPPTSVSSERRRRSRSGVQRYASIRVTRRLSAPAERVFDAWLEPEVAGRWLFATASRPMARVEVDARVGGSF